MHIFVKEKKLAHVMYRNFHSRRLKDHASYEISDTRMSAVRNQNKASENDLSNRMVNKRHHDLYKNNIINSFNGYHYGV